MAFGAEMDGRKEQRVFCVLSDGESLMRVISGEAVMFAKYNLSNLTVSLTVCIKNGPTERG